MKYSGLSLLKYLVGSLSILVPCSSRSMWIHGESSEQFEGIEKLVLRIKEKVPHYRVILTSSRLSTLEFLAARFKNDAVLPVPWNIQAAAGRFFKLVSPKIIILLENHHGFGLHLMSRASKTGTPVITVNVHIEHGDAPLLLPSIYDSQRTSRMCVQDETTASILCKSGMPGEEITVTGNLMFENASTLSRARPEYLRSELGIFPKARVQAPVIIAEKVAPEEVAMIINLYMELRAKYSDLIFLIEPGLRCRASRFIAAWSRKNVLCVRRSRPTPADKSPLVIIFDTPGELAGFYSLACCILAGGSFSNQEHIFNTVEPLKAGKPIIFGPNVPKTAGPARVLIENGAAVQVQENQLAHQISAIIQSPISNPPWSKNAALLFKHHAGANEKTFQVVRSLLPPSVDTRPANQRWRVKARVQKFGDTTLGKKLVATRMKGLIKDWDSLNIRLGWPQTILCLGNGPSSELPQLKDISYDCLFRVNWLWKRRDFIVHPNLVFVGDMQTMQKLSSCIFAFWNIEWESYMLLKHLCAGHLRGVEFFTMERVRSIVDEKDWYARPTNGALMIVTAAALNPQRLIISGIDLFRHPDGGYPGNFSATNEYAQVHCRNIDLEVIQYALQQYQGEVLILSDILRKSLKNI